MNKIFSFIFLALLCVVANAQEAVFVKLTSGVIDVYPVTSTEHTFNDDGTTMTINGTYTYNVADVANISYGELPSSILVTYVGDSASVVNPYVTEGITASIKGANVSIVNTNTSTEYTTELTGSTTSGSFLYTGSYKTTVVLNGVSITNPSGAAIDIECGKRVALEIKKGTENTLVDGKDGSQKAALYCKGHLEIDKAGTLNVTGNTAHAISAKEYIQLKKSTGTINILGAAKDGIHCKQYFLCNGYTINIDNVGDDDIQAEMDSCENDEGYDDGSINITNGSLYLTNTAYGGKGLTAESTVNISGDATIIDIAANGSGGVDTSSDTSTSTETVKSYKVYVAMPTSGSAGGWGGPAGQGGSGAWTTLYLYKSDGTLVQQLSSTVTKTSGYTSKTFYYYDFKASDSGTYYFKSANYTSRGGWGSSSSSYTIKSSTFSGPTTGEDYYYEISSSYTTNGTTRTYSLTNVTNTWNGSTSDASEENGDAVSAAGIKADGNITISAGTITIKNSGEMSKSIKSDATVQIDGGNITLTPSGAMKVINSDASYSSGIKTADFIQNDGTITINASGAASRGISATNITTNGGTLNITNTGSGQSGTNDSYTAKGLKADTKIALNAGTITIKMTGNGGKGIKSSGTYTQGVSGGTGPTLTVSTTGSSFSGSSSSSSQGGWGMGGGGMDSSSGSSAKAIKIQGAATIYGGNSVITTATNGAEGLESKTSVEIAGGNHYIKCYDDCINSSGIIKFTGGNTVCYATNNDAVDSNYGRSGAITIAGGNIFAYSGAGSPEEGLDCDNSSYITITSGTAISAGGQQGGGGGWGGSSSSSSVGSSSQYYYLGSTPSSYTSGTYYTLYSGSTAICTYRFDGSISNTLGLLTCAGTSSTFYVKSGSSAPTAYTSSVNNASGTAVFFTNPTVSTTNSTTITASK